MRAKDASRCSAVIFPLVKQGTQWVADCSVASPVLVPLLSLGRRVVASEGSGDRSGSFSIAAAAQTAGGPQLHATFLTEDMFAAAEMRAVTVDLMKMKVAELKEELEVREEGKTGNKAWLRRRLHAAIVRVSIWRFCATRRCDTFTVRPAPNLRSCTFTVLNSFCTAVHF